MPSSGTEKRRTPRDDYRWAGRGIAVTAPILLICLFTVTACTGGSDNQASGGNTQSQNAYNEFNKAVPYPYTAAAPCDPLERENLAARLRMYNSAGDTNYVYIFTWGSPTLRGRPATRRAGELTTGG